MSTFRINFDLTDRVAVVTGAAQGIGQAVAVAFAFAGADVALIDVAGERLGETAELIESTGRKALRVPCDVGDQEAVRAAFGTIAGALGPADALVNCAGVICENVPAEVAEEADMDRLWRVNVKGTFFTVGKALDKRPDISRALLADGQLLGNHSYHHDQWRWLDPRYPELERTQAAFRKELGVCPAFYRPPHGEHTPFMSYQLARKHMTMIGWDDSAADWATTNGITVARRILEKVKPGSIIVLHDGLDGDLTADRSVLTVALPIILRGLQAKGLHVERLDKLLGKSGYGTNHC